MEIVLNCVEQLEARRLRTAICPVRITKIRNLRDLRNLRSPTCPVWIRRVGRIRRITSQRTNRNLITRVGLGEYSEWVEI